MRRVTIAIGTTLTGLVLLFSWPTSTNRPVGAGAADAGAAGAAGAAPAPAIVPAPVPADDDDGDRGAGEGDDDAGTVPAPSATEPAPAGPSAQAPAQPAATSRTFDGGTAQTRWGPVQVQIVVDGGVITSAKALQVPNENQRDVQINSYAIPILNASVLEAQGGGIQLVSGATVTSRGYVESLQDALDQASL